MRYDRTIALRTTRLFALAGLVVGLVGLAPLMAVPGMAQVVAQTADPRKAEAERLFQEGIRQYKANQFSAALVTWEKELLIRREIGDRKGEGQTLHRIGSAYQGLEQYQKALEVYQQALAIHKREGDRSFESTTLSNMGIIYRRQAKYREALEVHQQALAIREKIGDRKGLGTTLNNIGMVYTRLGDYPEALAFFQRSLAIRDEVGDVYGKITTLENMGNNYLNMSNDSKALQVYQQALRLSDPYGIGEIKITGRIKLSNGEEVTTHFISDSGIALTGMCEIHFRRGDYAKALGFCERYLRSPEGNSDQYKRRSALNNIGTIYHVQKQYSKALEFYHRALAIGKKMGDLAGQGNTLSNIGYLLIDQKQPELAILFYKQSVNVRETIREGIKPLSRELQASYTQSVSGTYRALADLLLGQGRILEAQQVLELLKIQEIREFTREAKTTTSAGIATTASEAKILKEHGTLIAFGQTVDACKLSRCAQLSQLNDQQQALTQQYNQTVSSFEKEIRRRKSVDDALLDPRNLSAKAKEIVESQPGTVLIYPFVLEDKIWLLWAAKGGIVKSVQVPVSRKQLGETVVQFRRAVQNPSPSERKAIATTGKQLYDWLIKPLEPELKANKIQNLVFSLDRVTRYIPMSALFDGEKFLIETYAVSTVLSAELTDLSDRLPASTQTSILAMGASEFKDYNPLPNVPAELDAIVQQKSQSNSKLNGVFSGSTFLNQAFTFRALRDNLLGRKILHIATHGKFVSGRPEDSYLVLGTGEKLTIPEIKTLQDLSGIHLVVLSACETALGGADQDGVEISGLSSYFLSNGAKAVMASLWSVDDASTSELMSEFYRTLAASTAQKPMTKAEALRQAQLSLIREGGNFARPLYWAPFILIGNSL